MGPKLDIYAFFFFKRDLQKARQTQVVLAHINPTHLYSDPYQHWFRISHCPSFTLLIFNIFFALWCCGLQFWVQLLIVSSLGCCVLW